MNQYYQIAMGSVTGRDHRISGRNNQDACCTLSSLDTIIAIAADGCSSGQNNEVGAKLGIKFIGQAILNQLPLISNLNQLDWNLIKLKVISQIQQIAFNLGDDLTSIIYNYFLFTIIGVVINQHQLIIFSIGDGVYILNGNVTQLGPFPNNAPPYLCYEILAPNSITWNLTQSISTQDFQSVLIGTDGVVDLIQLTKTNQSIPPITDFWEQDSYFKNPDKIRRTLSLINRDIYQPNWSQQRIDKSFGLLPDDTTMIVIRRAPNYGNLS